MEYEPPRWMIHFCPFDSDCRQYDPPWRLAFRVPGWYISVALRDRDRFAGRIDMDAWRERGERIFIERSRWTMVSRSPRRH